MSWADRILGAAFLLSLSVSLAFVLHSRQPHPLSLRQPFVIQTRFEFNSVEAHTFWKTGALFIDARKLGRMETRVHRVFDAEDIERIAGTYHAWRDGSGYEDVAGFCRSVTKAEIKKHDYVLTPGRYVGAEELEDDGEPFEEKMERLVAELKELQAEGRRLDGVIGGVLNQIGFGA